MRRNPRIRRNPAIDPGDIAKSLAAREPYKKVTLLGYGIVWTDTVEGDDSFPPAIASYAPVDGWLFYKGRNGSEGVIVGSPEDVQRWMLAVDDQLERYPLATEEPWSEAKHGGAELVASAVEAARAVFAKFGQPLRRVKVSVSTDPMSPSHPMGTDGISLVNVHRPAKAHFLADREGTREIEVSRAPKVGAHEASHVGFGMRPDRAHYVIDVLKARNAARKPYLSDYHSFMGHAEGTAEAGAFYMLLPDLLREVAPEVYDAVAWWFDDGPDPRRLNNPDETAKRTDPTLWSAVVREVTAGAKGGKGGQWSARKAQLAVALYKAAGGGYVGAKSPSNSLARWTAERWQTKSGRASLATGERYLPAAAIAALSDAEYEATTRAKRAGLARGEQFTPQPPAIAAQTRRFRR